MIFKLSKSNEEKDWILCCSLRGARGVNSMQVLELRRCFQYRYGGAAVARWCVLYQSLAGWGTSWLSVGLYVVSQYFSVTQLWSRWSVCLWKSGLRVISLWANTVLHCYEQFLELWGDDRGGPSGEQVLGAIWGLGRCQPLFSWATAFHQWKTIWFS